MPVGFFGKPDHFFFSVKDTLPHTTAHRSRPHHTTLYSFGYRAANHDQSHGKCLACPRQTNLNVLGHVGRTGGARRWGPNAVWLRGHVESHQFRTRRTRRTRPTLMCRCTMGFVCVCVCGWVGVCVWLGVWMGRRPHCWVSSLRGCPTRVRTRPMGRDSRGSAPTSGSS